MISRMSTLNFSQEGNLSKRPRYDKSLGLTVVSILCLLVAIGISFMEFEVERRVFGFIPWGTEVVSISPSLISTMAAIVLYLSIVVRFKIRMLSNSYETTLTIIMTVLNILLCASFLSIFVGDVNWTIFTIDSRIFLMIAIIFSWVGMRSVAGFVWIILFCFSLFRMIQVDEAMGNWGVVYIIAAFLGITLQAGDFTSEIHGLKEDFMGVGAKIGADVNASKNVAFNAALNLAAPGVANKVKVVRKITRNNENNTKVVRKIQPQETVSDGDEEG